MRKKAVEKREKRKEGELQRRAVAAAAATPETPSVRGRKSSTSEGKVEVAMATL